MKTGRHIRRAAIALAAALAALAAGAPGALAQGDDRPEFVIVGMGDSYSAGEGVPQVRGQHDAQGNLTGSPETWGPNPEDDRCHRSPLSWQALAADRLAREYGDRVRVTFHQVACSGATIDGGEQLGRRTGGALTPYHGPEEHHQNLGALPPQTTQVNNYLTSRLPPERRIDAVLMTFGGNDAFFAPLVAMCLGDNIANSVLTGTAVAAFAVSGIGAVLTAPLIAAAAGIAASQLANCHTSLDPADPINVNPLPGWVASLGIGGLPARYAKLDRAFRGQGPNALDVPPEQVYIAEYPNPARDESGRFCDGTQTADPVYRRARLGEAKFIEREVLAPMDQAIADAAESFGWNLIKTRDAFRRHGVCADEASWFRTNSDALRYQGADVTGFGVGIFFSHPVSAGVAHPNEAGHQAMAERAYRQLRTQLEKQFLEGIPTLRVTAVRGGRAPYVRLAWTQPPVTGLARYRLEIREQGKSGRRIVELDAKRRSYTHRARGRFTYRLQACARRTCKTFSAPVTGSNVRPSTPRDLERLRGIGGSRAIAVGWVGDVNATRYEVEYRRVLATTDFPGFTDSRGRAPSGVFERAIIGRFHKRVVTQQRFVLEGTAEPLPRDAAYEVRVRACSDVGCSRYTPTKVFSVGEVLERVGEVSLTGAEQELLAPGAFADLGISVRHPRDGNAIRWVDVRLVGRDGPVGCFRLDQDSRRAALAEGDCDRFGSGRVRPGLGGRGGGGTLRRGDLTLDGKRSRITASGRSGKTFAARLSFRPGAELAGQVVTVQAAVRDDRGRSQGFRTVGALAIAAKPSAMDPKPRK